MEVDSGDEAEGQAASGDLDALFREHADPPFRTLCAFTGGRTDIAADATAEAFARVIAHRDGLRDPTAWIYRVAFRVAIDELGREGGKTASALISCWIDAGARAGRGSLTDSAVARRLLTSRPGFE